MARPVAVPAVAGGERSPAGGCDRAALGIGHARARSRCAPTSRTSSRTIAPPSSRTGSSAGIAIVAGDPIGPELQRCDLVRDFAEFAHQRGWRIAIIGASEAALGAYRSLGLRAAYHGDEAVVDTQSFSLDGRPIRKVRQSVHRLARCGYTAAALRPSEISAQLREQLEAIAREWRGAAPERGFVMALDALFGLGDEDAVFLVGFDAQGSPAGLLHFCISHAGSALSLSTMPRARSVPNGFTEWLICESIAWARDAGYARVSLNFSPFAALLAPGAQLSGSQRVQVALLRRTKRWFQLDNLLLFNSKFFPAWERRYVGTKRRRDLPRVGVAALAAESYPSVPVIAVGLVLAVASTVAINGGYALQHASAVAAAAAHLASPDSLAPLARG